MIPKGRVEVSGVFWQPENPENKVEGIFESDPDTGTTIRLKSYLMTPRYKTGNNIDGFLLGANPPPKANILWGRIAGSGTYVTLVDVFSSNSISIGYLKEEYPEKLFPKWTLFNVHTDELEFKNIYCTYTNLTDWISHIHIQTNFNSEHEGELGSVSVRERITLPHTLGDASYTFRGDVSAKWDYHRVEISDSFSLQIDLLEPLSIEDIFDKHLEPFRRFVDIATDEPNQISDLRFTVKATNHKDELEDTVVPVRFLQNKPLNSTHRATPNRLELVFSYPEIMHSFASIYDKWRELYRIIDDTLAYYLTLIQEQNYGYIALILITQAIEGIHALLHNKTYINDADYETIKNEINSTVALQIQKLKDGISSDVEPDVKENIVSNLNAIKQRIKTGSQYYNQLSQRNRLKHTLFTVLNEKPFQDYFEKRIGDKDAISDFVSRLIETRNYYIHLNKDTVDKRLLLDPNTREFRSHVLMLGNVFLILLLKEVGIPSKAIINRIENHSQRGRISIK